MLKLTSQSTFLFPSRHVWLIFASISQTMEYGCLQVMPSPYTIPTSQHVMYHKLQSSYHILLSISHLYRERDYRTWQCSPIFANTITIELDPPQLRQLPTYVDNLSFRWGPLWRGSKLQFSMSLANILIIKSGLICLWKISSEINIIFPPPQISARSRENSLSHGCVCFNPFPIEVVEKSILSIKRKKN